MTSEKIKGYRDLSQEEIEAINTVKSLGTAIEAVIDTLPDSVDGRWVSIGRTELQKGLMFLTRAIARPGNF